LNEIIAWVRVLWERREVGEEAKKQGKGDQEGKKEEGEIGLPLYGLLHPDD
jgi:hypothetical protein